jgi:GTP-dependent phosphoenolpyruvate carboxykinase
VDKLVDIMSVLKEKIDPKNLERLTALGNDRLNAFVAEAIELTSPDSVVVFTDSKEDIKTIREKAKNGGG